MPTAVPTRRRPDASRAGEYSAARIAPFGGQDADEPAVVVGRRRRCLWRRSVSVSKTSVGEADAEHERQLVAGIMASCTWTNRSRPSRSLRVTTPERDAVSSDDHGDPVRPLRDQRQRLAHRGVGGHVDRPSRRPRWAALTRAMARPRRSAWGRPAG